MHANMAAGGKGKKQAKEGHQKKGLGVVWAWWTTQAPFLHTVPVLMFISLCSCTLNKQVAEV